MDLVSIGALLAAAGSIVATFINSRHQGRGQELVELRALLDEIQEDRKALRTRVSALETKEKNLTNEVDRLREARKILTERITELAEENRKLHFIISGLRDKVYGIDVPVSAIAIMRQLPGLVNAIFESHKSGVGYEKEILELKKASDAIVSIIEENGG